MHCCSTIGISTLQRYQVYITRVLVPFRMMWRYERGTGLDSRANMCDCYRFRKALVIYSCLFQVRWYGRPRLVKGKRMNLTYICRLLHMSKLKRWDVVHRSKRRELTLRFNVRLNVAMTPFSWASFPTGNERKLLIRLLGRSRNFTFLNSSSFWRFSSTTSRLDSMYLFKTCCVPIPVIMRLLRKSSCSLLNSTLSPTTLATEIGSKPELQESSKPSCVSMPSSWVLMIILMLQVSISSTLLVESFKFVDMDRWNRSTLLG